MAVYLTGTGICLPNEPVSNDRIESILGQVGGRPSQVKDLILKSNRIRTRYYAIDPNTQRPTHTNAQLAAESVFALSENCELEIDQIELLACGTSSPDQIMPSHASMVQGLLGCPPCEVVSTAGVCCSSVSALKYAYLSVLAGSVTTAVVTGSDLPSPRLVASHFENTNGKPHPLADAQPAADRLEDEPYLAFENEFLRWMLSDGAGAARLEPQPRDDALSLRVDWIDMFSFAGQLEACMYAGAIKNDDGSLHTWVERGNVTDAWREGYLHMSQDVQLLKANLLPVAMQRSLRQVIDKRKLVPDQIDWLLPHLSSYFFEGPVHETLQQIGFEIPAERWFTNLAEKGNTGAASLLIMLDELYHSGRLQPGQRLLCVVPESARFSFGYLHLTVE